LQYLRINKVAEINKLKEGVRRSFVSAPQLIIRNDELYGLYSARIEDLKSHYQSLIAIYRTGNIRERSTDVPVYFENDSAFDQETLKKLEITVHSPDEDKMIAHIERIAKNIISEANKIQDDTRTVDQIFSDGYPLAIRRVKNGS